MGIVLYSLDGLRKGLGLNVRWLLATRRILKPGSALWLSGTHHIIFRRAGY
jgi:hypothetical protein